jgi:hypothetical protein
VTINENVEEKQNSNKKEKKNIRSDSTNVHALIAKLNKNAWRAKSKFRRVYNLSATNE